MVILSTEEEDAGEEIPAELIAVEVRHWPKVEPYLPRHGAVRDRATNHAFHAAFNKYLDDLNAIENRGVDGSTFVGLPTLAYLVLVDTSTISAINFRDGFERIRQALELWDSDKQSVDTVLIHDQLMAEYWELNAGLWTDLHGFVEKLEGPTAKESVEAAFAGGEDYIRDDDRYGSLMAMLSRFVTRMKREYHIARQEHARLFLAATVEPTMADEDSVPELPAIPRKPDGLHDNSELWWGGVAHKLPPVHWRIMQYMWSRNAAPVDDFIAEVWGHDEQLEGVTIRAHLSKLSAALVEFSFPWTLSIKSGQVVKS